MERLGLQHLGPGWPEEALFGPVAGNPDSRERGRSFCRPHLAGSDTVLVGRAPPRAWEPGLDGIHQVMAGGEGLADANASTRNGSWPIETWDGGSLSPGAESEK